MKMRIVPMANKINYNSLISMLSCIPENEADPSNNRWHWALDTRMYAGVMDKFFEDFRRVIIPYWYCSVWVAWFTYRWSVNEKHNMCKKWRKSYQVVETELQMR